MSICSSPQSTPIEAQYTERFITEASCRNDFSEFHFEIFIDEDFSEITLAGLLEIITKNRESSLLRENLLAEEEV